MLSSALKTPLQKPLQQAVGLPLIKPYLPLYQDALVALSTSRKLTSNATHAMRIRRESDNIETDIGFAGRNIDKQAIKDFGGYNLLGYTEDLSQQWNSSSFPVIVTPATEKTAGNTANTFDFEDTSTSSPSLIFSNLPNNTNSSYNASVYIKNVNTSNNESTFNCYGNGDSETNVKINWSTNTATFLNTGLNGRNLSFVQQADGFFRLSFDFDTSSNSTTVLYRIWPAHRSVRAQTGKIRAGGFQLTKGTSVKPYQPRTAGEASSCFVVKIYDQSGNDNHPQQLAEDDQPKIYNVDTGEVKKEGIRPAINFDGAGDHINIPNVAGKSNIDAYFVNRHDNTSTTSGTNGYLYPSGTNSTHFGFVGVNNSTNALLKSSSYGSASLYKNNVLLSPATRHDVYNLLGQTHNIVNHQGASVANWSVYKYGAYEAGGGLFHFEGTLQEIIIFETNLTTEQRQILHDDINTHYRIY